MNDQEKFNPDYMLADGYAEKFPLEPLVIDSDLETAKPQEDKIELSSDLRLEKMGKYPGLCIYKDNKLVKNTEDLSRSDLKLIRQYLDSGRYGNDLIPEPET